MRKSVCYTENPRSEGLSLAAHAPGSPHGPGLHGTLQLLLTRWRLQSSQAHGANAHKCPCVLGRWAHSPQEAGGGPPCRRQEPVRVCSTVAALCESSPDGHRRRTEPRTVLWHHWAQHRPLQMACWSGWLSSVSPDSSPHRQCSATSQPKCTRVTAALVAALGPSHGPRGEQEVAALGIRDADVAKAALHTPSMMNFFGGSLCLGAHPLASWPVLSSGLKTWAGSRRMGG